MTATFYCVKATPDRKYVRTLLSRLPKGYRIGYVQEVNPDGSVRRFVNKKHPCVLRPDGELLRHGNGTPVTVCSTPGSQWALTADLAGIRRAIASLAA